jgi:hypothetical protein
MAMAASVLRNIVEGIFPVSAKKVVLSGEISPTATFHGNSCWSSQTTQQQYAVWGFNPKLGFKKLEGFVSHSANRTDGTIQFTPGCKLGEVENVGQYIFFLVYNNVSAYNAYESESTWSIYKAPDFAAHWAAVTEEDVKRWEEWLNA